MAPTCPPPSPSLVHAAGVLGGNKLSLAGATLNYLVVAVLGVRVLAAHLAR